MSVQLKAMWSRCQLDQIVTEAQIKVYRGSDGIG